MSEKRERRTFNGNFKQQIAQLYNNGKPRSEIIREYDLVGSAFDRWVKRINTTGSSHEKGNRTPGQEELMRLWKENQQLKMENDISKQAALALRYVIDIRTKIEGRSDKEKCPQILYISAVRGFRHTSWQLLL